MAMTDKEIISNQKQEYRDTYESWREYYTEADDDEKVYLGDQWLAKDAEKLARKKMPAISRNFVKPQIDLLCGFNSQNQTDIKVFPIEGADQEMADIYTQVIKWTLTDNSGYHYINEAFRYAVSTGIGWVTCDMTYDHDPIDGDMILSSASPFAVMPDAEFCKPDLSDANFIYHHKYLSKSVLKSLYPSMAKEIENIKPAKKQMNDYIISSSKPSKSHINVVERWYKEYEERVFIFDTSTNQMKEWTGDSARLKIVEKQIKTDPTFSGLKIIKKKIPVIKMTSIAEDEVILYNGESPHQTRMFPFIPIFCYFSPHHPDWKWKLCGLVRNLKDSQREANKRLSKTLEVVMSQPQAGWIAERGAVQDPDTLKFSADGVKVIEVEKGKMVKQIQPPQLPGALIAMQQQHMNDMREIGVNPDLMGMIGQGGSSASAPGIAIQLRQRSGITRFQPIFDSLSFGKRLLGRYLIQMINNNYSTAKIERIVGKNIPQDFDEKKYSARYDCAVDDLIETSSTYRLANFLILMQMAQQGMPVPPEMLIRSSVLNAADKAELLQNMADQQAAAQGQVLQNAGGPQLPPAISPEQMAAIAAQIPVDTGPPPPAEEYYIPEDEVYYPTEE